MKSGPGRCSTDQNQAFKKRLVVGRAPMGMSISPRSETCCHNFSFFEKSCCFFENLEGRNIRNCGIIARFRFWGNAHTRWRSPDHKVLLECVTSVRQTTYVPGLNDQIIRRITTLYVIRSAKRFFLAYNELCHYAEQA